MESKPGNLEILTSENAAKPAATYSSATKVNFGDFSMIYCAGCIGMDPATSQLISDDVEEQTRQAILNLKAILEDNGSSLENITRCNVFLTTMDNFTAMNKVYTEFFNTHIPARTAVAVYQLPFNSLFEIQADATVKN